MKYQTAAEQLIRKDFAIPTTKIGKQITQIIYTTSVVTKDTKGNMMSNGKFRISISLEQMDWIINNCKDTMPDLYKQLSLAKTKAELGYTKPAFAIAPKLSVKTKKALSPSECYSLAQHHLARGEEIPEHLQAGYMTYRYDNDLMSPEEMEDYENQAMQTPGDF